jgi:hypothetical protein
LPKSLLFWSKWSARSKAMETPVTRKELCNMKENLEKKRLFDITVKQICVEVISDVIAYASDGDVIYTKTFSVSPDIREGVCSILRKKFPDSSVYFRDLTLFIDWSLGRE